MRRVVRDEARGNTPHLIMGLKEARKHIKDKEESLKIRLLFSSALTFFLPTLGTLSTAYTLFRYYQDFYEPFLSNKVKKAFYDRMFAPVVSEKLYTIFGYRIYQEDLQEHLSIVNGGEKKLTELIKKGKWAKKQPHLQVGFDIGTLTTHLAFIGTTGAGKTETILSFVGDILASGGGFLFIDGKADQAIEQQLYTICKKHGYETQFFVNNYINPENRPPTNTFSPALSLKLIQLKEFLNSLLPGGGDGNQDYFKNRGKVAAAYPIGFLKIRQKYHKEPFTFSDITNYMEDIEFTFVYVMLYAMTTELNELIKQKAQEDDELGKYLKKARKEKIAKLKDIEDADVLVEFMTRNPDKRKKIENILGVDIDYMATIVDLTTQMDSYISGVYSTWKQYTQSVAKAIKAYLKYEKNKRFLYIYPNFANIKDIREAYNTLKNDTEALNKAVSFAKSETELDMNKLFIALGVTESNENLEKLKPDDMRQHQYAQQQWDRVFQLFNMYKHIFNDLYPDVDLADIIRNNKVLYVMFPVLNMAEDQLIMIAKMYVILIKLATSLGLGGENQEALPLQLKIYQNKLKPLPLYMVILDEWGSYATAGMATQNAQARSLKISMVYSTQDKASFLPENDDREMKRILGNMKKLVLQVQDEEIFEYVEKYIDEVEVLEEKEIIREMGKEKSIKADTTSLKIEKKPAFPVKKLSSFSKGLSLLLNGDNPIIIQSYYVGENPSPLRITTYKGFEEEWENV
ncbi:TraM recognition domain-containing protein [Caminibacter pacificus]|uniref:Uncharacterized protein n=1 Tax=Caminibacter pacificus TaxID=1424653 RepID=A0AAJ4UWZ1_9BACT|nr:TraM recognition domain-containing protein [Caminibacter pacificus]QDD68125.1 hypothetical protein C6V80_09740 [Caminibacter pacificus]ROR38743.1 hypothetical protein EDC58_1958 [Caminibacter pacificus]